MRSTALSFWMTAVIPLVSAQFPATPSGLTIVNSSVNSEVTISFKQTDICETTQGVKSYSGFVHLPGSLLSDVGGYDINSYFLYFEARQNASTAPLAIYLAGGPGESSTYAAMSSESGPCYVNIDGTDTVSNPWSFNNDVNMLYIDQPVQAGFSYDTLVNGSFNLLEGDGLIIPMELNQSSVLTANASFGYGTYPSQDFNHTANNTVQAAKALWHFAEHWMSSFPEYTTESNKISIWGNSWGGYWVPETAVQFSKNLKNLSSAHPLQSKNLTVDAIGITNGCIDIASSITGYPDFAYNNTYGIQFGTEDVYEAALNNITKPDGCLALIDQCRELGQLSDPDYNGSNETVNELCEAAFGYCEAYVIMSFDALNQKDAFDIAINATQPLQVCDFYLPVSWYLNNATTQAALGVPLNFTYDSNVVTADFGVPSVYTYEGTAPVGTGDAVRQNGLPNIEYLLANNVKVAFIFGDRDYRCPWTGGEATALAANWTHQNDFASAGYEKLQGVTTPVSEGGLEAVVKQYGQFSFSRVLDSGHMVSAYAPETVYRIFERTIKGLDVVTGMESINGGYTTTGPRSSLGWRNQLPATMPTTCMVEGQFQSSNPWDTVLGNSSSS